jgi:Concanavalin A-like lectin/glucanases superfamily
MCKCIAMLLLAMVLMLPEVWAGSRLFNGSSDTIIVPGSSESVDGTNSYSMWVYFTALPSSGVYTTQYSDTALTGNVGVLIIYANIGGVLQWYVDTCLAFAQDKTRFFNQTLSATTWYHVGVTVDASLGEAGDDVKVYVNGSRVSMTSHSGAWGTNSSFYGQGGIGCLRWGPPNIAFHNGRIGRLARFKTVLNQAQITSLSRGTPPERIVPKGDLVCNYDIEGLGSVEVDRGPNRLDSTSIVGTSRASGPPVIPR